MQVDFSQTNKEMRGKIDSDDSFMQGHRIIKIRRQRREVPEWAKNDKDVQKLLLRSFPNLGSEEKHRTGAARWARIIYLYFRMQNTYGQISKDMKLNKRKIEYIIRSIYRVSRGLRANGSGLRGSSPGRVRGWPKGKPRAKVISVP